VDHDIEGHAAILWGTLAADGWPEIVPMRLVTFAQIGLPPDSPDRAVWRFAQTQDMLLLTGNRNMDGDDSLEQTIREEATATSLPVLTVGRVRRLYESNYRRRCVARIVEIVLYLERYRGNSRIFIL
jgi:hypothetical protein